jgi:cysteine desulfurase/selenocysteine lyase
MNVRSRFACFQTENCTYLDSAATTQVPDVVLAGIARALFQRGNPNRSAHRIAERSHALLEEAKEAIASFLKAKKSEIVFTTNSTDAVNLAVDAVLQSFRPGDGILISIAEHHSNILPYLKATARGARVSMIGLKDGFIDIDKLKGSLSTKTRLVAVAHCSNVLGNINDVAAIGEIVKSFNQDILYLVDGTQAVAHLPVDVKAVKADFYVFSGHKMYGPDGVGVLYASEDIRHRLAPVRPGGGTVTSVAVTFGSSYDIVSPEFDQSLSSLSGGTPNTSNIVGLAEAVRFLEALGWKSIREHERQLLHTLLAGLRTIDEVEIYGPEDLDRKIGVVSFALRGVDTMDAAGYFASRNICIRYGSHCALPLADSLGRETLRVSLGLYNTEKDVLLFLEALKDFLRDRKGTKKQNPALEFFRNVQVGQRSHLISGEPGILRLIDECVEEDPGCEVMIMGGHFLGIPSVEENRLYPSIDTLLPAHLRKFTEQFGMTSFPLYTFSIAADAVSRLKAAGIPARLFIIANDTTGINELRLSKANSQAKTAEHYRRELLAAFEQDDGLPRSYLNILSEHGLSLKDLVTYRDKFYFRETILRARFKKFISRNKTYFDGLIDYVADDKNFDIDIRILADRHMKNCSFDTFHSKTGGEFCVVTVAQLLAELFGKADGVSYDYLNENIRAPKSAARNGVLAMLSPAMCNNAIIRGAELYTKLFLQNESGRSIRFLNIPLGPRARETIRSGVEATEIGSSSRQTMSIGWAQKNRPASIRAVLS